MACLVVTSKKRGARVWWDQVGRGFLFGRLLHLTMYTIAGDATLRYC